MLNVTKRAQIWSDPAVATSARYLLRNTEFQITVSGVIEGVVTGTLEPTASDTGPQQIHPGVLVDFAERLAITGCEHLFGPDIEISSMQSSVTLLNAITPHLLMGRCQLSQVGNSLTLGETSIWDNEAGRVAAVSQIFSLAWDRCREPQTPDLICVMEAALGYNESASEAASVTPRHVDIPTTRRQQIFDAATKIFTEKGFEGASMREISREAGLSIPTMYQYFRSKDDILELIFDTYLTKVEADLRSAIVGKASATERLIAAIGATFNSLNIHHRQIRIMSYDTKSLRIPARTAVINRMRQYLHIFTGIISEGVQSGEFRQVDPELFGNLLAMMCQVWIQRHWSVGRFGLHGVQAAVVDLVINSLEVRSSSPTLGRI
jgi:AcrR family transcriptional regulator